MQCHHTIPAEIAEKVSEKILEGKQFCAYIVIPLHPEGDPAASATQEILAWQVKLLFGVISVLFVVDVVGLELSWRSLYVSPTSKSHYLIAFPFVQR